MNDLRTAAQRALEALEAFLSDELRPYEAAKTSDALRAALAQQAEPVEPVAWMLTENEKYDNSVVLRKHKPKTYDSDWWTVTPLYTAPPQRKPLTEEEIDAEWRELDGEVSTMFMRVLRKFARAVERAHGITDPQIADRLARHGIPMPGDPK